MKKIYEGLELSIIELTGEDVLTLSLDNDAEDEENWDIA